MVPDISKEILKLQGEIDAKLDKYECPEPNASATSDGLSFDSFKGLFLITGVTSTAALTIFLIFFLYEHRHVLYANNTQTSIWKTLATVLKLLDKKDESTHARRAAPTDALKDQFCNHQGPQIPSGASPDGNGLPSETPGARIYLHI